MKKLILMLTVSCIAFISCNSVKTAKTNKTSLQGSLELNYISGPRIAFNGLYPEKKPTIIFDLKENRVSGNNSCNNYTGALKVKGKKIDFKDAKLAMTMMACEGQGGDVYMSTLDKIDSYSISEDGKTLNFIMGAIAMMRFTKK